MSNEIANITIQPDYFKKTAKNESVYPLIWRVAKEVIQNSRDAGASQLVIHANDIEKSLEFIDDAGGMDVQTLQDVFLSLGGSKKNKDMEGGSIGGFGDAKKVIFLCWDRWEISTQDLFLSNAMLGNESIRKTKNYIDGTRIKIWVDSEEYDLGQLVSYIELCQLDMKIEVHHTGVNGGLHVIVPDKLYRRRLTRELPFGSLYINKSQQSEMMIVRMNGLALFYRTVYGMRATAVLELEIDIDPKDKNYPLNVTREDLKWEYKSILESIIREIVNDPTKAFKPRPQERIELFRGGKGKVKTVKPSSKKNESVICLSDVLKYRLESEHALFQSIINELNVNEESILDTNVVFKHDNEEVMKEEIGSMPTLELINLAMGNSNISKLESGIEIDSGIGEIEEQEIDYYDNSLSKVFPYDFLIKGKTNLKYDGIKYQKILLAWHKAIEYVCYYNNLHGNQIDLGDYTIGFVFDDDVKAQYFKVREQRYILINPSDISFTDYSWRGVVMEILIRACHEISHDVYLDHDGNFVAYESEIRNTCLWYIEDFFNTIGNIVRSKKETLNENAMLDEEYEFEDEE